MVLSIVPDNAFVTSNTEDLKTMVKIIPKEPLNYNVDFFEKDFKVVLNHEQQKSDKMKSFNCE